MFMSENYIMAPNIDLARSIATETLDLEKHRFRFFAKMAAKTTSGSGFLFKSKMSIISKNVPGHFLEKFGVKVHEM